MLPGMMNQNLSHQVGGDGEELRAAATFHLGLIDHPQIRLVDQRRRLERVVLPFASNVGRRQTAQLAVQQRDKVAQCLLITATPGLEQTRHVPGFRCRHSTTPIDAIVHRCRTLIPMFAILHIACAQNKSGVHENILIGFPNGLPMKK
jgi:hypothetical protein